MGWDVNDNETVQKTRRLGGPTWRRNLDDEREASL